MRKPAVASPDHPLNVIRRRVLRRLRDAQQVAERARQDRSLGWSARAAAADDVEGRALTAMLRVVRAIGVRFGVSGSAHAAATDRLAAVALLLERLTLAPVVEIVPTMPMTLSPPGVAVRAAPDAALAPPASIAGARRPTSVL